MVDPSITDAGAVANEFGADSAAGLTGAEAARRLAEQGRNELRGAPMLPTWRRVLAHFQDPLIYLLLAAIAIALLAWFLEGPGRQRDGDGAQQQVDQRVLEVRQHTPPGRDWRRAAQFVAALLGQAPRGIGGAEALGGIRCQG